MNAKQYLISSINDSDLPVDEQADLVLGFGLKALMEKAGTYTFLREQFPNAVIGLSSSAGEVYDMEVYDENLALLTISFDKTTLRHQAINIQDSPDSFSAGADVVKNLMADDLQHILILSDGSLVNGSELVKGIQSIIPDHVSITGGLAGDGADFDYTLVGLNEPPTRGRILAIGFYGKNLRVAHGSFGGWEPFGLERTVTKSSGNELFEVGGKNALSVYKEYLGKYASELPGSALLFPLSIRIQDGDGYLVRTILSIDEEKSSMTFAGDLPEGSKVRFMKANTDRLIDAASVAANTCLASFDQFKPQVALLVSCLGRKLVLANRVDEEVEAVAQVLGEDTVIGGYYSYGEISPYQKGGPCELHNQTMTITCMQEID
ncbi:histidine kinase [Neolewinella aurantiaca]|uniref:Histidine kinase n=1 Tax=Neolewinella aurantiaca TaxID=2602767 RepID=A0A5C7F5P0_9BACT|nr:FIST N-terminal domain-containing protein [Neolewinella aurantiaca]TXF85972.1 histidine kinase [Neolewinella aurantiaca]